MQLVQSNTLAANGTIVRPGNRTSGYLLEESIHFLQKMLAMFGWQIHFWLLSLFINLWQTINKDTLFSFPSFDL